MDIMSYQLRHLMVLGIALLQDFLAGKIRGACWPYDSSRILTKPTEPVLTHRIEIWDETIGELVLQADYDTDEYPDTLTYMSYQTVISRRRWSIWRFSDREAKLVTKQVKRGIRPSYVTHRGVYRSVRNDGVELDGNMTCTMDVA